MSPLQVTAFFGKVLKKNSGMTQIKDRISGNGILDMKVEEIFLPWHDCAGA